MPGVLCLEDGFVAYGRLENCSGEVAGEVVVCAGPTGYEDVLLDPSLNRQILIFSFPLVGSYGFPPLSREEREVSVRGIVVRSLWDGPIPAGREALGSVLAEARCPVLYGVDTRRLVQHLRDSGPQKGVIARVPEGGPHRDALERLRTLASSFDSKCEMNDAIPRTVTVEEPPGSARGTCVVVDLGARKELADGLVERGYRVVRVPPQTPAREVLAYEPSFVLFSPGPGCPDDHPEAVAAASALLGKVPLLGICLGHQVVARAAGAGITRLAHGHHGTSHPVRRLADGKVFSTSQSHVYAVDDSGLPADVGVTYRSATDGTIEGLEIRDDGRVLARTVQFNPDGMPGPAYPGFWDELETLESEGGKFDA